MRLRPVGADKKFDIYEDAIRKIRRAVDKGMPFDQACSIVSIENSELREAVIAESLETLIAEMHLSEGMPLKQLAMRLKISMSRLLKAKEGMRSETKGVTGVKRRSTVAGRLNTD